MENNVENVRYHTDRIAILLATYNGEQYLQEQLDSLLSQTCQDWVTYIHDDGSTDQTMKVIEEYTTKYPQAAPRRTSFIYCLVWMHRI